MEYAASVRIIRLVTRTGNHNLIWLATARQRPQPGVAEITAISPHSAATSIWGHIRIPVNEGNRNMKEERVS